jgi:signal transduction histidine kinase
VAVPVAVGLYASRREGEGRFGRLLVLCGLASFLPALAESDSSLLHTIGRVSAWVSVLLLVWLILSFPRGFLETGVDRALVAAGLAVVALLYLPTALLVETYPVSSPWDACGSHCPGNAFLVAASQPGFVDAVVVPARELLTVVVLTLVMARLANRVRGATALMRRTLEPVLPVAIGALLAFVLYVIVRRASAGSPVLEMLRWAVALSLPATAIAFAIGLLRWKLYVADALEALGHEVTQSLTRAELRAALATALRDPALDLLHRVEGAGVHWVNADGRRVEPPTAESSLVLTEVRGGDRAVAGLVHDRALCEHSEFVEAVSAFALIALDKQHLAGRVEETLSELRASRARIAAAADRERRKIERDLHDSAQQRLVALRIQLDLAETLMLTDPHAGTQRIHDLREGVDAALAELRSLARGIYPPLLAERGIGEALRAAALRLPVHAVVKVDGAGRYPQDVENAVYFCCLEGMQNASKHARTASNIEILLEERAGSLRFEVRDDGAGYDTTSVRGGTGLSNMRDRLAAVGGEITVSSEPGGGTSVSGEVPAAAR